MYMAVIRKVQSKIKIEPSEEIAEVVEVEQQKAQPAKFQKRCLFCTQKSDPIYLDTTSLRRFMSDRGKIKQRVRTGVCSKHQIRLSRSIKQARHLALLPFTVKVR